MAQLVHGLTAERVRANLAAVRDEIAATGRPLGEVEIVAAVKYVAVDELGVLADAGLTVLGENRAQDLEAKAAAHGDRCTFDFIGQLQSRKVKAIAPLARFVHSVGTDSALEQLAKHPAQFLVQVNIAGEEGKAGVAPDELPAFLDRCPREPAGLMTMPPLAQDAEDSRRWFAALRELAERHGLAHLSMGTTQDFAVAVQEGATMVRIGRRLYA